MKVFYSDRMVADPGSFSPSAGKPALAVQSWMDRAFDISIIAPTPVTEDQLCRAHAERYVHDVLSCRKPNGFGTKDPLVAASLLYTNGAMVAAAHAAVASAQNSCAPVSGFHHAGYGFGGGYCTFNGLIVAAMDLLQSGAASRVGILDCDQHYGNGTDDILRRLDLDDSVVHFSQGNERQTADPFLGGLPALMRRTFSGCDLLLYQAGADPHVDDPLGGWLTTAQLRQRDQIVFRVAAEMGLPVAWDLAGGYQRDELGGIAPVLEIHDNTMRECLAAMAA